jgi:hypothetical protein
MNIVKRRIFSAISRGELAVNRNISKLKGTAIYDIIRKLVNASQSLPGLAIRPRIFEPG